LTQPLLSNAAVRPVAYIVIRLDNKFSHYCKCKVMENGSKKRGQGKDRRSTIAHPFYHCTPFTLGFVYSNIDRNRHRLTAFFSIVLSAFYVAMESLAFPVFFVNINLTC
jgi:hypothetical protein